MRIIFMGTPDFAVASLQALLSACYDVVAVVTAPDKPAGRGQQMRTSAVKDFAVQKGLPVLQPEKLKNPDFILELESYKADIQIVVAFRMLPEVVWNMPPLGTLNVHASLLPQYRGAAPINWAIINGEKESGVTLFKLQHEIDTGNILATRSVNIDDDETAGDLHDKLMITGSELLIETLKKMESRSAEEIIQDEINTDEPLRHAPKLSKEDGRIDWLQPVQTVYNLIRGLSPYPTAFTMFQDKTLKIFKAEMSIAEPGIAPGAFLTDGKSGLKFACKDGFICLLDVQLEGKKRMPVMEFLKGIRL